MIIAPFDFETTGVDRQQDRVIELGVSLYSTGHKRFLDSAARLVLSNAVVSPKISKITGIYQSAIDKYGYEEEDVFDLMVGYFQKADAILGHNIRHFDWPMAEAWARRLGKKLPDVLLIDTMEDIPGVDGEKLVTMCANAGFTYAAHSALADCQASMKLAVYHGIDAVVERAHIPTVVVQSLAPRTNTNSDNKEAKFRWNPEFKIWWKAVKETDIVELAANLPFKIAVLDKSVSLEQLRG